MHDTSHLSEVNARATMGLSRNKPSCGHEVKKGQQTAVVSNADRSVCGDRLGKKDKTSQFQRQIRDIELPLRPAATAPPRFMTRHPVATVTLAPCHRRAGRGAARGAIFRRMSRCGFV